MFVLCPKCWNELKSLPADCPHCGTSVDLFSPKYERRLLAALTHANPERRAQICWVLGSIDARNAVHTLVELLHDPDVFVRVAALRGLGEIGDPCAFTAVEKATVTQNLVVRTVARNVLKTLEPPAGKHLQQRETPSPARTGDAA